MTEQVFKKNSLVILEGIMGSGKSTQAQKLVDYFSKTRSVGYVDTGKVYPVIKQFRPENPKTRAGVVQESFFFQFMNWVRFGESLTQDLSIVDRFLLSNCVYTLERLEELGIAHNLDEVKKSVLAPLGFDPLEGTMTIYLDCPVDIAYDRAVKRQRSAFNLSRERNASRLYERVLHGYSHTVIRIDGARDRDAVHADICSALELLIK